MFYRRFANYLKPFSVIKTARYIFIGYPLGNVNLFLFAAWIVVASLVFYMISFAVLTTVTWRRVIALSFTKPVPTSTVRCTFRPWRPHAPLSVYSLSWTRHQFSTELFTPVLSNAYSTSKRRSGTRTSSRFRSNSYTCSNTE